MSKYKDIKMIDWIVAGIIALAFISVPAGIDENIYYSVLQLLAIVFLIYCFLSGAYWVIHKHICRVFHYLLIIAIYSGFYILYVIAVNSGI